MVHSSAYSADQLRMVNDHGSFTLAVHVLPPLFGVDHYQPIIANSVPKLAQSARKEASLPSRKNGLAGIEVGQCASFQNATAHFPARHTLAGNSPGVKNIE